MGERPQRRIDGSKRRERPRLVGGDPSGPADGPDPKESEGSSGSGNQRERSRIGMDVRREPKGKRRKWIWGGVAVAALAAITFALSRLEPAAPSVDRNVVVLGTVERGDMVREVRGTGTLVPERVQFVTPVTSGRVVAVYFEPGETVSADDVLLELANPDVELEVLQAEQQWTAAQASLVALRETLGTQALQQEAAVADARARFQEAKRQADAYAQLVGNTWVSDNEYRTATENAEALEERLRTEQARLTLLRETADERMEVQRDQVERLGEIFRYQRERAESMKVQAGADGVLQDFSLEPGQWVQSGTLLARVAKPDRLKAELRIPQTQARDVQVGQQALIDTRTDTIPGRVRRIDPNVQQGSVLVEVSLEGELPAGARPDLSVDGTIQLELLEDVLYVGRPAYGQSQSTVSLFEVVDGGDAAVRTTVELGRASVNHIEVLGGLAEGDEIILSDMSRYDDVDRVRIR